jgi:hypothetical protein
MDDFYPTLYLGPVSRNIVDAVIFASNRDFLPIGLIPSRRQFDYDGGYVNSWNTSKLASYIRNKTDNVFICRDHGGPDQGKFSDNGRKSLSVDGRYFDLIHLDPFKKYPNIKEAAEYTHNTIRTLISKYPYLCFEVGTEEAIFPYTPEQLTDFLNILKYRLKPDQFQAIAFCVIQSGTGLDILNGRNTGTLSEQKLLDFVDVCDRFDVLPKEHNGDFLSPFEIEFRFKNGLQGLNIAPELGRVESQIIWDSLVNNEAYEYMDLFFNLCVRFAPWQKWLGEDFNTKTVDKELFSVAFGHYIYREPLFQDFKNRFVDDSRVTNLLRLHILNLYDHTIVEGGRLDLDGEEDDDDDDGGFWV